MAGKIKQTSELEFKTKGAKKVQGETEQVGKSFTRLGQTTASAGRQFSAQANGLGGLVAVYAGAAANVFALQQAFSALSRAAQFDQLIAGTNTLAASVGTSGSTVINTLKQITNEQLTIAEAATTANIALSAGFNIDQINKLGEVSLKASRALGRNLTDALTRLSRGTAKLEPELLDELGIFTRLEPALERYALQTGKSVQSLTAFERRQAFVNAAIEEGDRKFGAINTSVPTTAEAFEKLAASFIDLATKVGSFLAETLVPLAEFFTENLLAQLTLFGVVAKTVFGIGLKALGTGVTAFFGGVGNVVDGVLLKLSSIGPSAEKQAAALDGLGDRFSTKGFSLSRVRDKETISPLVKRAREGSLDAAGAIRLQKGLKDEQKVLKTRRSEIIKQIRANGGFAKSSKALQKEYRSNTAALRQLNPRLSVLTTRLQSAGGMAAKIGPAFIKFEGILKKTTKTVGRFARGFQKLGIIGIVAGGLTSAAGKFFGFETRLNEILESINQRLFGGFFGKETEDTIKDGIAGIVDTIVNESDQLKNVTKVVRKKLMGGADDDVAGFGFDFVLTTDKIKKGMFKSIDTALRDVARGADQETVIQAAIEQNLDKAFGTAAGAVADQIKKNPLAKAIADATRKAILDSLTSAELLGGIGKEIGQGVGAILAVVAAEIDGSKVKFTPKKGGEFFEAVFGTGNLTSEFDQATTAGKTLAGIFARQAQFTNELQEGTSSLEKAQRDQAEIKKRINDLEKKGIQNLTLLEYLELNRAKRAQETTDAFVDQLAALENQRKLLEKNFGSEIKAAQRLTDLFDSQGKLVTNQNEQRVTSLVQAKELFEAGKDALALQREGETLDDVQEAAAQAALKAEQAIVGTVVKNIEAVKKFNKELEKRTRALMNQTRELEKQNKLTGLQQGLALEKQRINLEKSRFELLKKQTEQIRNQADASKELSRFVADAGDRSFQTALDNAGGIFTAGQKRDFEIKIATKEFERIVADQQEAMRRASDDAAAQKTLIEKQIQANEAIAKKEDSILQAEKEIAQSRVDSQLSNLAAERETLVKRFDIILKERDLFNGFIDALARVLAEDRVDREIALEAARGQLDTTPRKDRVAAAIPDVIRQIRSQAPVVMDIKSFDLAVGDLRKQLQKQVDLLDSTDVKEAKRLEREIKSNELKGELVENQTALNNAQAQASLEIMKAKGALDQLKKAAEISSNRGLKVAIAGLESFGENAKTSLNSMFKAIREGTLTVENFKQGFQDFILSIVDDIQASITEEFIVNPIKDFLATQLQGLFPGLFGGKATPAATTATATSVTIPNAIASQTSTICACLNGMAASDLGGTVGREIEVSPEVFQADELDAGLEQSAALFGEYNENLALSSQLFDNMALEMDDFGSSLISGKSSLSSFISALGNMGGAGGGGFSGIGSVLSAFGGGSGDVAGAALASSGGTAFSTPLIAGASIFASGGYVRKMAAGGMMRDRVPAMLEPGEFVMQRKAVNRIGAQNLSSMNGTGNGMPSISVEVKNEGSPKDAQARVQPQMDVNKMVVEIVTRDIRNNGPIRKTLRTGAE